jgi:glycosyltransferase involved in cell wall biosynthesis
MRPSGAPTPLVALDCVAPRDRGAFLGNAVQARELALALDRRDDVRLALLVDPVTRREYESLGLRARLVDCAPRWKNKLTDQLAIGRAVWRLRPDLYHKPNGQLPLVPLPGRVVVTIADLNFQRLPCSSLAFAYKDAGYARSVRRAARVICLSAFTQSEVHFFYPRSEGRTVVVHNGTTVLPPSDDSLAATMPGAWFLTFGHHRYKNVTVCLEALARMRMRETVTGPVRLVVLGTGPHLDREIRPMVTRLGLTDRVVVPGRVSDAVLHGLYRGARGLLFLSCYEGFGLPVLEAMQAGCPVVAAHASSLPEVAGDAAILLGPNDAPGLAAAMEVLVRDPAARLRLQTAGHVRAAAFSWDRAAAETAAVYRQVLAATPQLQPTIARASAPAGSPP